MAVDLLNIRVRRARFGDHDQIHLVLRDTFLPFLPEFKPTALKLSAEDIGQDPAAWVVAVSADGSIVGAANAWEEFGYVTFCFLSLASGWCGQGVGQRIVNWIIDDARQSGVAEVRIVLRRELEQNIRYFQRFGFRYQCEFGTGQHDFYHLPVSASAEA